MQCTQPQGMKLGNSSSTAVHSFLPNYSPLSCSQDLKKKKIFIFKKIFSFLLWHVDAKTQFDFPACPHAPKYDVLYMYRGVSYLVEVHLINNTRTSSLP